jgi:cell division protein ZapE
VGVAGPAPVRLVDRFPDVSADELVERFVPPHRFGGVRFETYVPNPEHPSQAAALTRVRAFAGTVGEAPTAPARRGLFRRRTLAAQAVPAVYLDGGYGVGKTHLLAALWHAAPADGRKAYLAFHELTAVIGFLGMKTAVEAFRRFRLLCIDEFELDDVANTLMTVTFLRSIIAGTKVATTSNSLPDRLGEGRFHADDFRREIAAIASHFEVVRIDGPDYRRGARVVTDGLADDALDGLVARQPEGSASVDDFDALLAHLRAVHPVRFAAMLDGLDVVAVRGVHPITNQGDALLWCQLVDELYDAEVTFAASGCGVDELFPETYRHGGYRKKYGRCESRLAAMLAELQGS